MKQKRTNQNPIYKRLHLWTAMICVAVAASTLSGCSESDEPVTKESANIETPAPILSSELLEMSETSPAETTPEPGLVFEFDALQNGFISISSNTTVEEVLSFIDENALFYTKQEYNTTTGGKTIQYKIAYEKGVSYQSHADSGDYLKISFDLDSDNQILNAEYVNSSSIGYSALFYNYGTWYDFHDTNAEDYSGYYNVKSLHGKNEGIVVKYANGNEAHTNYFPCSSSEEAIENILKEINN